MKRALITGITGQDGSYLAELLLSKGYRVFGMVMPHGGEPRHLVRHLEGQITYVSGDLTDSDSLERVVGDVRPDEVYNLAAQSFVPLSWKEPVMTADVTGVGAVRLFDAVRRMAPGARVFQASSAAMFGDPERSPQDESTPIRPTTPYGAAKAYAHAMAGCYRAQHKLFVSCGILFNHESPRRGPDFVTRKVTLAAARIRAGRQSELRMGELSAVRDWGYAPDYVEAAWRMLQQEVAEDFVVASGRAATVADLVRVAFETAGLDWKRYVVRDESFVRPEGPAPLVGDAAKARRMLGWAPKTSFEDMIRAMTEQDLREQQMPETAGALS